jgi:hypothetical protein
MDAGAGNGGSGGAGGSGGTAGTAGAAGSVVDAGFDSGCPTCSVGLALYWKFDESSGTAANDASGNGTNGLYTGTTGTPSASTLVPPLVRFSDPRSRSFVRANHQGVQLANMPSILKPANDVTVAAWYRATTADANGSEIVSAGDQYLLRVTTTQMTFSKSSSATAWSNCYGTTVTGQLDGNWHHVAGVTTAAGMTLYFDGVQVCTNTTGANIAYAVGTDFWVGRHGAGKTGFDFEGNIDEVRVYTRALTAAEIAALAAGAN